MMHTSFRHVSVVPDSDDPSGGPTPQLPPGSSDQDCDAANPVSLPATEHPPCQRYSRLGIQSKGTNLTVTVPGPKYTYAHACCVNAC